MSSQTVKRLVEGAWGCRLAMSRDHELDLKLRGSVRAAANKFAERHGPARCPVCGKTLVAIQLRRGPGWLCGCPQEALDRAPKVAERRAA